MVNKDAMTGKELKALRKKLGVSARELGEMIDRAPRTMRHYEADAPPMPAKVVKQLREVLKEKEQAGEFVPPETLMGATEVVRVLELSSAYTLTRWEKSGVLIPWRTGGGLRKYLKEDVMAIKGERDALARERAGTLSTMEVVHMYAIPKKTLYFWVEKGLVSAWRDSQGTYRYDPGEVERFLESR